jgi:uncharacterized membrane protein YqiK
MSGFVSPRLGIRFEPGTGPDNLTIWGPDGEPFQTTQENIDLRKAAEKRAEDAEQRAEDAERLATTERQRTEIERQRAEDSERLRAIERERAEDADRLRAIERQRADSLAAKLRELGFELDSK